MNDYIVVLFRTSVFYLLITFIYRLMGKREIGQLGVIDLIVSILIAELAAISIDNHDESIWISIYPIFLLTVIQITLAWITLKNSKLRGVVDGKESVIINRGVVNFKEMIKQRYNLDDLMIQLRQNKIRSIEEVDYAILEASGKLSVFKNQKKLSGEYPIPLILDGQIDYDTLSQINKDKTWLLNYLNKKKLLLNNIFYAFYKDKELFVLEKSSLNKD